MNSQPLAVIAGVGKGLGVGLVEFFLAKNYRVLSLNRSASELSEPGLSEYLLDLSDEEQVKAVAEKLLAEHGVPDVLIHNTQNLVIENFEQTTAAQFEACWQSITLTAFLLAQAFLPAMEKRGSGAMIVSGATASIRGGARFSAFSSAKFALRGLTQSLARSYQSKGIHVVHVLLDGIVATENSRTLHGLDDDKMMSPEDIASIYWQLTQQPLSTWSHELDLRPATENF